MKKLFFFLVTSFLLAANLLPAYNLPKGISNSKCLTPVEISKFENVIFSKSYISANNTEIMSPDALITIGTGTSTQRQPFGMFYGYERDASLYTSTEIGTTGIISSLAWYVGTSNTSSAAVVIYIKTTTATTLTASTWATMISGATTVYTGTVSFSSTGWATLTLTTPFTYSGNNLIVLCETNYGGGGTSPYPVFRYTTSTSNSHEYWYADNAPPTGNGTRNTSRPNIQMNINPASSPNLIVSPTSLSFGYVPAGSTSTELTYLISGTYLSSSPVTVSAPSGFEVSLTSGSGFGTSVSVSFTPPTLGSTTIYTRFKPTLVQTYSGNITNSGGGASTVNVAVTGTSILTYCSAGATTCDEYISNVTVGSINNSTACTSGGYTDYTSQTTNMYIGSSNTITVTNGLPYSGDQCGIWVDWNHNGLFTDANETITVTGGPSSFTANITPPAGSYIGTTRMRVRIMYTGTVSSCGTTSYGEVEDYSVAIDNIPPYPIFSINPTSKSFGNAIVGGGTADQQFVITNSGGSTLTFNPGSVFLSGSDINDFLLIDNNSYPINLTNGQTAYLKLVFTPVSAGAKSVNLHIDDNTGGHDIPLTGNGLLNAPQNLIGGINGTAPSLSWSVPNPEYEIKLDDGTVEANMWVASPSTTNQYFYDKFISPHNGNISQISLYAYGGSAGLQFNSVLVCPDDGTGKPNMSAPWATFSNVNVGTAYSWIFLTIPSPQSVTAGQIFYILAQWPAGSTTGPYMGTDNTTPASRSAWTQDGGTTWNLWTSGNFIMRAYMGTYSDKFISGTPPPVSKILPVETTLLSKNNLTDGAKKELTKNLSVQVPYISVSKSEKSLLSYTLLRGDVSGTYNTNFSGISGTSYDDNSAVQGNTYFYVVRAEYSDGSSGNSNEVSVTAINPNYGTFASNQYKFSNSTAYGNPAPGEKPAYEWIPTYNFTQITAWTSGTDDDGYFQLDFPGQYFKFFGTDYNSVYIGTNGYITFGAGSTLYNPYALPSTSAPFNMIAAAMRDCYVYRTNTPASNISYKINSDNVIISYENLYAYGSASGTNYISFQIILNTSTVSPTMNSLFIINFNDDLSALPLNTNLMVTTSSTGVNNGTGTIGYNYRFSGAKGPMFNGIGKSAAALALGMVDYNSGALPVTLSSFGNSVSGRDVTISWITASENNNAGFELLRKNHAENDWTKIAYLSGQGNKNSPTSYRFTDSKLNTGRYSYRLRQIDINGNYTIYTMSGFAEIGLPSKFNLSQNYPNPFNPVTKIDYDLPLDCRVSLEIFDILGRLLISAVNNEFKKAGYYTAELKTTNLSSGTYFFRISAKSNSGSDFIATKKMVLLK